MKRTLTGLCLAAAASMVMTVSAQSGTMGGSTETKETKKSDKSMTFTGCVEEGQTPGTYKLTKATTAGMSTGSGTSGSGTSTGTSGSMSSEMTTFELVPASGVELKNHVGHQVQVTGTIDKKDAAGTSGSGTGTSGSGTTASGMSGQSSGMDQKLKVKSLKMISTTCSSQ